MEAIEMLTIQRLLGCSIVVAGAGLGVACGSGEPSDGSEATGEAVAAITEVPADVSCITIGVTGSRSVTQSFDVTPGESSVFSLGGLPVGDVLFNGSAHPVACASVTSALVPTWISDPTPATLIAGGPATNVTIKLKRNGQATVGVDFEDTDVDGGTCQPGFGDCDGTTTNGCETDLNTSVANCGTCGAVCSSPSSTAACVNGVCAFTCLAGTADCNLQPADGCETNLSNSVTNCGACGRTCGSAHATAACSAGQCLLSCNSGFANCNGNSADGCEVDLLTSRTNCGACGVVCPTNFACIDGVCEQITSCLLPPC
jgi:hypothetical protein